MYIVIELQQSAEDQEAVLTFVYSDWSEAVCKYHTILSYAAKSGLMCHTAMIVGVDGIVYMREAIRPNNEPVNGIE